MTKGTSRTITVHLIGGGIVAVLVILPWLLSTGIRPTTPIETVSSVPYPVINNQTVISEALAHFDIQLHQPLIAKKAVITITFLPGNVDTLALGIRENSFWLSYTPTVFFDRALEGSPLESITKKVEIPLTDKLPDQDGSLDSLIFANHVTAPDTTKNVTWELLNVSVSVENTAPTWAQTKTFIKSVIKRERII